MMMLVMTMMMTVLTGRLSQTTRSQGWRGDHGAGKDFVFQIVDRPAQNLRKWKQKAGFGKEMTRTICFCFKDKKQGQVAKQIMASKDVVQTVEDLQQSSKAKRKEGGWLLVDVVRQGAQYSRCKDRIVERPTKNLRKWKQKLGTSAEMTTWIFWSFWPQTGYKMGSKYSRWTLDKYSGSVLFFLGANSKTSETNI